MMKLKAITGLDLIYRLYSNRLEYWLKMIINHFEKMKMCCTILTSNVQMMGKM